MPITDQQLQADRILTLTPPNPALFSILFYYFRASTSAFPTTTVDFVKGEINFAIDLSSSSNYVFDLCGATYSGHPSHATNKWALVSLFVHS